MATTNIWQQFKSLIPEGSKAIITITAQNSNGTSTGTLRDGTAIVVQGDSVPVGQKALIQDGEIKAQVPDLTFYESTV